MTRIWKPLAMLFLALTFALPALAGTTVKEIRSRGYIRVALANEIPYGYLDLQGNAKGIAPDIARKVLARMGIKKIRWVALPFGSLIPALKANRVDMVAAGQAILPARCQQVAFSEPNSSYGEGLLVKKGNPKNIHGYGDFVHHSDLKMGIVSGADQIDYAHAMGIPDGQIVILGANVDAVSALISGRIDAYAATRLSAARLADKSAQVTLAQPFSDPVIDGRPARSYGGFTFRKDDAALLAAFNRQLKAVQQTPFYATTLKHYGLPEKAIAAAKAKTTAELCAAR
jgi:polar amino acid transport system substrate-binding protein